MVLVDWKKLTYYPCYFSALGNTKLVAQCTAQVKFDIILFNVHQLNSLTASIIIRERERMKMKTKLIEHNVIISVIGIIITNRKAVIIIINWINNAMKKIIQFIANDATLLTGNIMSISNRV